MKKYVIACMFCLFSAQFALAETSLWKVSSGSNILYLGGTVHLLSKSDYPLPLEFEKAYTASSLVILEVDGALMQNPQVLQQIQAKSMYSDGSTLESHLTPKAYAALKAYCEELGVPVAIFSQTKPAMAFLTLMGMELIRLGIGEEGVDMYFQNRAASDNKPVAGLETIEEQIDLVTNLFGDDESAGLILALQDLKETRTTFPKIIAAWRSGDEAALAKITVDDLKAQSPAQYKKIFVDRNTTWTPKIEAFLKTQPTELILVGAGHLVGPDGVLALLKQRGYRVEKVRD